MDYRSHCSLSPKKTAKCTTPECAAVATVNEDVNELRWCVIPLLASLQGGVAASSRKCCEATEADAAGVVFLCVFNGKTTPAARSADASRHFINRSASPPCGDERRGITLDSNSLTLSMTAGILSDPKPLIEHSFQKCL